MNKTMKIIDLLNKIANGEEVPKKIKYNETEYNLNEITGWYQSINVIGEVNEWFISKYRLNDTVEIIEEVLKLDIQEIEELSIIRDIRPYSEFDNRCLDRNFETIIKQQNKILEAVKQLDSQINNKGGESDE